MQFPLWETFLDRRGKGCGTAISAFFFKSGILKKEPNIFQTTLYTIQTPHSLTFAQHWYNLTAEYFSYSPITGLSHVYQSWTG